MNKTDKASVIGDHMSERYLSLEKANNEQLERPAAESSTAATRIRPLHVLILGGLGMFGPLATDMYLPSLPAVSQELSASMSLTQITLTAYILGLALGQIIAGPISDALGRRRPLLVGVAAFVIASLLCIIAPAI